MNMLKFMESYNAHSDFNIHPEAHPPAMRSVYRMSIKVNATMNAAIYPTIQTPDKYFISIRRTIHTGLN